MAASQILLVPIDKIKDHPKDGGLRKPKVDSPQFQQIKESMEKYGQPFHSVTVLPANADGIYYLIDGHQRTEAARLINAVRKGKPELGETFDYLEVKVRDMEEKEISLAQMLLNMATVPTTKTEYANQLKRIISDPAFQGMSFNAVLAQLKISKTPKWLQDMLKLDDLLDTIKPLVNSDKIPLSAAYYLAKLDDEEQLDFLESAQTMKATDFIKSVSDHLNKKKAEKTGEKVENQDPLKGARGRTLGEHKERFVEIESRLGAVQDKNQQLVLAGQMEHAKWSLQLDEETVKAATEKANKAKAERDAKAAERKAIMDKAREIAKTIKPEDIKTVTVDAID